MSSKSEVVFLLGEMGKWHSEGLMGEVTYHLLRSRYWPIKAKAVRPTVRDLAPEPSPASAPDPRPVPNVPEGFAPAPLDPTPPGPYLPTPPLPHSPTPPLPISPGSSDQLEEDLQQQAAQILAHDPPPEPDLDQQLEDEACYHLDLEQRVRSASRCEAAAVREAVARPVARRVAGVASAACSALADVAGAGLITEPPPPPEPQQEVLQRDSLWSSRVQPFLHENALWLASGLLIICGSLYFLSLVWDQLSSLLLHAVIAGSLLSYGAAFFGVGYVLSRRRGAHAVGRILFCFSAAILPLASVATGELAAVLIKESALLGGAAAVAVLALVLVTQWFMLAVMGGLFQRSAVRPLTWSAVGLSALIMGVAPAAALLPAGKALLLASVLGFVVLRQGLLSLCRGRRGEVNLRMSILFVGGNLLWAMAVLVGRVQVAVPLELVLYAPLSAALAGLLISCDHRLRLAAGNEPRLSPLGLGLYAMLMASLALAVIGLARLGYFNLGARIGMLATSAVAVWFLWQAAARHGRSVLTYLAAGTGLFTYFFLPAPFTGLVMLANRYIKTALGYQHEPLPVAYYGLAFIPYLAGLTVAAVMLARRGRDDLSRDLQRFMLVLSGLLVLAATSTGADLRPSLWTWPVYAVGAFGWAMLFERRWLHDAGQVVTLAFLWVLGAWMQQQGWWGNGPAPVLAAYGLVVAASSLRFDAAHLPRAGLAAAGLSLVALVSHGATSTTACLVLGAAASAAALASFRYSRAAVRRVSRVSAHLSGLLALAFTVACAVRLDLSAYGTLLLLMAHAAVGSALAHWCVRARDRSRRRLLLAQPATTTSLLALLGALSLSLTDQSYMVPAGLALLAMFAHLALISRGRVVMVLCAVAAAVEVATLAHGQIHPRAWPLALTVLACVYLLGSARLKASPLFNAHKRSRALLLGAYLVQAVALLAAALHAEQTYGVQWLWWGAVACGEAALFFLCATHVHRTRALTGVPALVLLAAASAASAAFLLEYLVPSVASGVWQHGALFAGLGLAWCWISGRLTRPHLGSAAMWVGGLLPLFSMLCLGWYAALAGMQCGAAASGLVIDLLSLRVDAVAVACAGLALLAALYFRRLRGGRGTYADHLLVAAGVGLGLVLFRLALPQAHLSLALGLAGVVLAWQAEKIPRRGHRLGWPLGLCSAALLASHMHLGQPHLLVALACLTAALVLCWRTTRHKSLELGWALGLLAPGQALVIWLARELSTGRHPPASVLCVMAAMALATGLLLDWLQRRPAARAPLQQAARVGRLATVLAALGAAAAMVGSQPTLLTDVLLVSLLTLAGATAQLARGGLRDGRVWMIHCAWLGATLLYVMLRTQTGLSEAGPVLDAAVILLASQLALWTAVNPRLEHSLARGPLLAAATLWPLLAVVPCLALSPAGAALLCLLCAMHYAAAIKVLGSRSQAVLAMVFANSALVLSYSAAGWSDMMLYLLPLSITLLTLVHIYGRELGPRGCQVLRALVLVALYTLATGRALVVLSPFQALVVVPAICVAGIVVGSMLRVRIYVWMGVGFLAADLLLNMLRHGLAHPHLGALFLTVTGLVIVAGMVLFTLERERILARYSAVFNELKSWE